MKMHVHRMVLISPVKRNTFIEELKQTRVDKKS